MIVKAKIYKPSKNAMQSGRGKTKLWVLEYDASTARKPESLMGWQEAGDTLSQVRIKFESCEQAIAHAEKAGIIYSVIGEKERKVKPRNYGDNFKYISDEE